MTDDPLRWRVSPAHTLLTIVPFPFLKLAKRRRLQVSVLQNVREFHLSMALELVAFLAVLVPIARNLPPKDATWIPAALAGVWIYSVLAGRWFARRPLADDSAVHLAAAYRTAYFLQAAFATSLALWGFVAVFIIGRLWPYLVGMPAAEAWLWAVGPTTANIERVERGRREAGSRNSLIDAITAPPAPGM